MIIAESSKDVNPGYLLNMYAKHQTRECIWKTLRLVFRKHISFNNCLLRNLLDGMNRIKIQQKNFLISRNPSWKMSAGCHTSMKNIHNLSFSIMSKGNLQSQLTQSNPSDKEVEGINEVHS